jgi:hypothetical protein
VFKGSDGGLLGTLCLDKCQPNEYQRMIQVIHFTTVYVATHYYILKQDCQEIIKKGPVKMTGFDQSNLYFDRTLSVDWLLF